MSSTVAQGQIPHRFDISNVSNSLPCQVTTVQINGLVTFDFVRLTSINIVKGNDVGMSQLNNYKYRIIVTGTNTFTLQDPITFQDIDSTLYGPYVTSGQVNKVEPYYYYHADEDDERDPENSDEDRYEDQTLEGTDDSDTDGQNENDEDQDSYLDDKDRIITNRG